MTKKLRPNDGTVTNQEADSGQTIFNPTDESAFRKAENEAYAAEYEKTAEEAREDMEAGQARRKAGLRSVRTVEKVDTEKIYNFKHEVGIFKRRGGTVQFTEDQFGQKSEKKFRKEARSVKPEKRDKFLEVFKAFHEHKEGDRGVVSREDIIKFAAGMKTGQAGSQFDRFSDKLKKEGMIKRKEDLRKMFTPREIRVMRNSLTGQTEGNLPKLGEGRVGDRHAERNTSRQTNRQTDVTRTFNRLDR